MAPDAILIEDALALRLLIVERNQTLWVVPIGLDVIRAAKRIIGGQVLLSCGRPEHMTSARNRHAQRIIRPVLTGFLPPRRFSPTSFPSPP